MVPQSRPRVYGIALHWKQCGGTVAEAQQTVQRTMETMMRMVGPKDVTPLDDYLLPLTHPVVKAAMQAMEMHRKNMNKHAATGPAAWGGGT